MRVAPVCAGGKHATITARGATPRDPSAHVARYTRGRPNQAQGHATTSIQDIASQLNALQVTLAQLASTKTSENDEKKVSFGSTVMAKHFALGALGSKKQTKRPILDSECNMSSFGTTEHFNAKTLRAHNGALQVANGVEIPVVGQGDVGELKDVQLVDGLEHDLISIGQLCDDNKRVTFTSEECIMTDEHTGQRQVIRSQASNGL